MATREIIIARATCFKLLSNLVPDMSAEQIPIGAQMCAKQFILYAIEAANLDHVHAVMSRALQDLDRKMRTTMTATVYLDAIMECAKIIFQSGLTQKDIDSRMSLLRAILQPVI